MGRTFDWKPIAIMISIVALVGCDRDVEEEPIEPEEERETLEESDEPESAFDEEAAAPKEDRLRQRADEADQQLRQRLMGRVMEVAQEDGFDAAVHVCRDEAIPITEEVAQELDVEIGRVSDRLRNPDNTGHDWVWRMIEEADGEPLYAENDPLRAVKPIHLAEGCVNCHGNTDELAPGVEEALNTHYPDDQATGYEPGDLRGWVWVEVSE